MKSGLRKNVLQPKSMLVIDNVPYHCVLEKIPTMASSKLEMQQWLEKVNNSFHTFKAKLIVALKHVIDE